jgi:uncharacterized protein (TIGR02246 family)
MTDLAAVLARLDHLERIEAARALTIAYARAVDAADIEAVAALFTPDAVLELRAGKREGREAIEDFYRTSLGTPSAKRHWMTNHAFDVAPDGVVTVDTYFIYTFAGSGDSTIGWGDYHDVVAITDDGARFTYKSITRALSTDVREGWAG